MKHFKFFILYRTSATF